MRFITTPLLPLLKDEGKDDMTINFMLNIDKQYMRQCFELAKKGAGKVSPNPLVGCVIVKNGKIIAAGYHKKFGGAHAERNAINAALKKGISLKGANLYVNLEPCVHFGKTPPCADYIIEQNIGKVIIGCKDPYYKVSGKGLAKLKKAGISSTAGILNSEAQELNKFFIKFVTTGMPYVMLKAAQTIDGKIADDKYRSKWISSANSRKAVHKLRAVYDAVLVGKNTVIYDNPQLNVRNVKGRNPYRIIIDKDLMLNNKYKIFKYNDGKTIVLFSEKTDMKRIENYSATGVTLIPCKMIKGKLDFKDALKKLAEMDITSIMVEGGAYTFNEFLKNNLADEVMIFIAPKIMGRGLKGISERKLFEKFKNADYSTSGADLLVNLRR
ncbi:MAG: bifunctional diaminohydroxyphosphoribosylaminopyrimidine deaminase/5-amino-6-(5-phosphoribosylamino)uracil reductase RibD [Ignavibacteria bacterium]|nr:bifunctional diaminohydroxyphosphoribosylaminopyrimidine deaminase/5-amino-6-(5-phosphoribosylamino)uracil reductase RibD [Ignavibacteria bacterium]